MPKFAEDRIPDVSIDDALPSGPVRRGRRRSHREKRSGERKQGDSAERRAARVGKLNVRLNKDSGVKVGYRVIVSGLLPSTTEAQVRSLFSVVGGRILKCEIGRKEGTNRPVGVAQVIFETRAQADKAAHKLNEATVDGRVILVQSRGLYVSTKTGRKDVRKRRSGKPKKKEGVTAESLDKDLKEYMK